MKVKMRTLDAGPDGVKHPGKTYDVSEAEGKALIAGGYAVEVKGASAAAPAPAAETEKKPEADKKVENAAATAAPEAAHASPPRQEKPAGRKQR